MANLMKCTWPELGTSVRFQPAGENTLLFDWFRSLCPMAALQSHAVVSGECAYVFNLPARTPYPGRYEDLRLYKLTETSDGDGWIFVTHGRVASFCFKYGYISEPMSFAYFTRVVDEDLDTLVEAGHLIWNAVYRTKQIITCEFTAI